MGEDLFGIWKNFLMTEEQLDSMFSHYEEPKYIYNHKGELMTIEYIK